MANPIFANEKSTKSLSEFDFLHDPSDKNSKLGTGSFASVKLAKEKKSGKQYAVKIIGMHPSKITSSDLHNIKTEITIHRSISHPNIVQFHDYIQKDHNIYLILEYAESGNLYSYIHKRKNLLPEEIFRFFYQTCLAIQYLHQNDILHRDLKPENLLLDKNKNLKLCDFGWSTRRINERRTTFCGTYEYMAPEIVHKKTYDYRVDIWSLGVLLYELIHREAPYKGRSLPEITKSLAKPQIVFSSNTPAEAKDLILKILKNNPNDRLSIAQILSHPWVQSHLSSEEDDSLQTEELIVSPRELKPVNMQSAYCESPKQKPRRENENFKSEIIMTTDDASFVEILNSKTRKNSYNQLYSSFHAPTSAKNRELSKDKLQKSKLIGSTKTLNQSEAQSKTPLQESLVNGVTSKPSEESLTSMKNHTRSSPSLAQKALEKLGLDEKSIRNNIEKKRRIFESNMLSPTAFKSKIDGVLLQLSSHTTTNKLITERAPQLFGNEMSSQTPAAAGAPVGFKFFEESSAYGGGSSSSNRPRIDIGALNMKNSVKSSAQRKASINRPEMFSTLNSPMAQITLSTRSKMNTKGSEGGDQENSFGLLQRRFGGEKPMIAKPFENVLGDTDQNKVGNVPMSNEGKRKQSAKQGEEKSSSSLRISSLSERRNEKKENKKDVSKNKENQQLKFREEYVARWEC